MEKYEYIESVSIDDILLDAENPRFASSELVKKSNNQVTQEAIIEHLLGYANIIDLAKSIYDVKELHPSELVTCYKNEKGDYISIEGNRRVCACKLLLNRKLIPQDYLKDFIFVKQEDEEEIKNNIQKIRIVLYNDRNSLQRYLSDRHIQGVKKWSALEKNNYYMNLFDKYKAEEKKGNRIEKNAIEYIKKFTTDKDTKIISSIIQYKFFMNVYDNLKKIHTKLEIEKLAYLPMVTRFMSIIVGDDKDVGLSLKLDTNKYKYICPNDKIDVYNKILVLIGEAFLVRKRVGKKEKEELKPHEYRISSTEIGSTDEQKSMILEDKRIPGLIDFICQFRGKKNKNNKSSVNGDEQKKSIFDDAVDNTEIKSGIISNSKDLLIYIDASDDYKISYSITVINLISQINKLYVQKYNYNEIIACSMRAIFEISVHELKKCTKCGPIFINTADGLENNVQKVVDYVKDTNNKIIGKIVTNAKCHKNFSNTLDVSDFKKNVRAAHLGAHSSSTDLTTDSIKDLGKHVGRFVLITNELLNNKNIIIT